MIDLGNEGHFPHNEEERLQRLMRLQEEEEEREHQFERDDVNINNREEADDDNIDDNNNRNNVDNNADGNNGEVLLEEDQINPHIHRHQQQYQNGRSARQYFKVHYTKLSITAALCLVHYALRSREQVFLAITFLSSSKIAYIILGNAIVAIAISLFHLIVNFCFDGGLRATETEAIGEHILWNVTETCLALTVFRSEVDVSMGVMFLLLVLGKCLHWSCELRGSHLRMTEEVFYFYHDESPNNEKPPLPFFLKVFKMIFPKFLFRFMKRTYEESPRVRFYHVKFFFLTHLLLSADIAAMTYCGFSLYKNGASVHILFAFEAAILSVSALSVIGSYHIHIMDGIVIVIQHAFDSNHQSYHTNLAASSEPTPDSITTPPNNVDLDINSENINPTAIPHQNGDENIHNSNNLCRRFANKLSLHWKDHRAILQFAIELLAQAATFLFYLMFFAIVFTYYGAPINICREVYMSYQTLRRSLSSFASYCRLTKNMNERFPSVTSEEELDECGRTCIICRDIMEVGEGCKKLPGCGHIFHKHCLREWLVHQQTCPTCRADIQAGETRVKMEERLRREQENNEETNAFVEEITQDSTDTMSETMKESMRNHKTQYPAFPCLYRVTGDNGATVVQFNGGVNGESVKRKKIRVVSCGKVIACTEMKYWFWDDDLDPSSIGSSLMLHMPDGWVSEEDIERISPALIPIENPPLPNLEQTSALDAET